MPSPDFTPNSVWASNSAASGVEQLTLQSGQTCLARKVGMEGMISSGILSEGDTLSAFMDKRYTRKVRGAKGKSDGTEVDIEKLMMSPTAMSGMVSMVDRIIPMIVVEPTVARHLDDNGNPIPVDRRLPGVVYTDQIDFLDKFELFAWSVGTVTDLEPFRGQAASDVATLANGPGPARKTKRAGGNKR